MKIDITTAFYDRTDEMKLREAGKPLTVTEDRGAELIAARVAKAAAEPAPSEPAKK